MPLSDRGRSSYADDLRDRSDAELAALLAARPDLARPAPVDLSALAARAAGLPSVHRALDGLDRAALTVLEALALVGDPIDEARAHDLLGVTGADRDRVTRLVHGPDGLWARGLVWLGDDGPHLPRAVLEALGPAVVGLGPGPADAGAVEDARAALAAAPALPVAARAVLDRMAWGPPVGSYDDAGPLAGVVPVLVERGLVVRDSRAGQLVLPRAVGLALRGGRSHRDVSLSPPEIATTAPLGGAPAVEGTGGSAAADLLGLVDELAALWGPEPPRVLRAGGLAVADLRRVGRALDLEPERAAFVVELAYAAGLVEDDGDLEPVWAPTPSYDEWLLAPPGARWLAVARAWLATTRAAQLVGTRTAAGPVNALSDGAATAWGRTVRHDVLSILAELPHGACPERSAVLARLRWQRPRRDPDLLDTLGTAALDEAAWLGLTGAGALTTFGRALLTEGMSDADLAEVAGSGLPGAVDHVLLQADLTAVVPGRLEGALAAFLRLAADLESRGGASVFRFTPESLRRCLDAGWDERQVLDALAGASRTGVPQPLVYLVGDVARRHGAVRVGGAASYLRCDDPGIVDGLLARPELASYGLRRLSPTVATARVAPTALLAALRQAGVSPVAEAEDGSVVSAPRTAHRARSRRTSGTARASQSADDLSALVTTLRAGEQRRAAAAESRVELAQAPLQTLDPAATTAFLRDAAASGRPVWVGVVDALGSPRRLRVVPSRVSGGRLHGYVDDGPERSFSLHRIAGVSPAGEGRGTA